MIFIHLLCPIMLESLKKNPYSGSSDIRLYYFGPLTVRNYLFATTEDLLGNYTQVIFIYLLSHFMLKDLKKILRGDPEIKLV